MSDDKQPSSLPFIKPNERLMLLANVSGSVAGGVLASAPVTGKVKSADDVATIAIDIAEAILKKLGL